MKKKKLDNLEEASREESIVFSISDGLRNLPIHKQSFASPPSQPRRTRFSTHNNSISKEVSPIIITDRHLSHSYDYSNNFANRKRGGLELLQRLHTEESRSPNMSFESQPNNLNSLLELDNQFISENIWNNKYVKQKLEPFLTKLKQLIPIMNMPLYEL